MAFYRHRNIINRLEKVKYKTNEIKIRIMVRNKLDKYISTRAPHDFNFYRFLVYFMFGRA